MTWDKFDKLKSIFHDMGNVVVAFSGGIDSTLLLKGALDAVGPDNVLAVTADSETYPASELQDAIAMAKFLGVKHKIVEMSELSIPGYAENNKDRCYFCKQGLFSEIFPIMEQLGYNHCVYGLIADDMGEHRPGIKAAIENGVRGPLQEVGLYKEEIRSLAKELGLPNWNKPAYACLSSRVAYGERITQEKLTRIEKSEMYFHSLGIEQVRVRHHGDIARIELDPQYFHRALKHRDAILAALQSYGYKYITLDLAGYVRGSMNKQLEVTGS